MDTTPVTPAAAHKATPRDFFLWLGAVIALYGSISALIALLFHYIDRAFPDALTYIGDGSDIRFFSAVLIVLVPTTLVLLRAIRRTIQEDPSRATVWVRRWALVLTIFIASTVVTIDLITLLYNFLNGEVTTRFILKVAVVLLIALGVTLHFLADLRGYWVLHPRRAQLIGLAAGLLALVAVAASVFIVGSPREARLERFDAQKINDLQSIQYQLVNYWQQKQALPESLADLNDPLSSYMVPNDPQTNEPYAYEATGDLTFNLCADFNLPAPENRRDDAYPSEYSYAPNAMFDENWQHEGGRTCFDRTIDPERYPPFSESEKQQRAL